MTRATDISKIVTDASLSGTLDVAGDLTVDTSTLKVDSTNNRVGIGTSSPVSTMHLEGDTPVITLRDTSAYSAGTGSYIQFQGKDSSETNVNFGQIHGLSLTSNNGVLAFYTRSGGTTAERVRITDVGRVGIGTSSPSELIHANGSSVSGLQLTTDTYTNGTVFKVQGDGASYIYNTENAMLRFGTNNLERMRIDSSGHVGILNTTPSSYLDGELVVGNSSKDQYINVVTGTVNAAGICFQDTTGTSIVGGLRYTHLDNALASWANGAERMRITSDGDLLLQKTSATTSGAGTFFEVPTTPTTMPVYLHFCKTFSGIRDAIDFNHNGTKVGGITFDNTSTTYGTSSDYRLKENVTADWDATTRLKQLNPVRFNFIADADTTVDGFLAHEVQSVVPEAITGTHNEVDDDGNPVYQGIDQSKLVPLLVKTIQELEARIVALETA